MDEPDFEIEIKEEAFPELEMCVYGNGFVGDLCLPESHLNEPQKDIEYIPNPVEIKRNGRKIHLDKTKRSGDTKETDFTELRKTFILKSEKTQWNDGYCRMCQLDFGNTIDLSRHQTKSYSFAPSYSCRYCTKKCRTRSTLLAHAKKMHSESQYQQMVADKAEQDQSCTICFKPVHFSNGHKHPNGNAIVTQDIAADYNCVLCRQSFFLLSNLQKHMNYKHECEVCRVCNKLVDNEDNHVETEHVLRVNQDGVDRDLFFCQVCGIYFEDSRSLKLHSLFKDHYQKLNFGCLVEHPVHHDIGEKFNPHVPVVYFPDNLVSKDNRNGDFKIDDKHNSVNRNHSRYSKTSMVNATEPNKNYKVLEIMDTQTLKPLISASPSPRDRTDTKPRIECEFCSETFLRFRQLEVHTKEKHFTELQRKSKDCGVCRCCFLKFDSLNHYNNNHRNESGYACEYCDEYHKKTNYKPNKSDCASVASASYSSMYSFRTHCQGSTHLEAVNSWRKSRQVKTKGIVFVRTQEVVVSKRTKSHSSTDKITTGLHITSESSSESESEDNTTINKEPNMTNSWEPTSTNSESIGTDLSTSELSENDLELSKQIPALTTENTILVGEVSASGYTNEQANQKNDEPQKEIENILKPVDIKIHQNRTNSSGDILEFHHLHRKQPYNHISCNSCFRTPINCTCCIRPSTLTKQLNFEQLSKCAGCLQYLMNGKKVCTDSVTCRELEKPKVTYPWSKLVSAEILDFHNLYRNKALPFVRCKSCDRGVNTRTCKCCIRPTHLTKYLTFDEPSKCAGCLEILQNGKKSCAEVDSGKCRELERRKEHNTHSMKRKRDSEIKDGATRAVYAGYDTTTRNRTRSHSSKEKVTTALHIISDSSSESESENNTTINKEPNITNSSEPTSTNSESIDPDLSASELSKKKS